MGWNYGEIIERIGSATRYKVAVGAHNFKRGYYESKAGSGKDVRMDYEDLMFSNVGGGEVIRLRAIANGLLCAAGATINAAHLTARIPGGKTISGAMNALRATLEVAGTNPTPGGTLSALQLDSNIVTGATMGVNDAFIRVGNSGATNLGNLFNIEVAPASNNAAALISTSANAPTLAEMTHTIRCRINGTTYYIYATAHAPHA